MHNAPAVSYPAERSSFAGLAMLAAWTAGASGLVLWWAQVGPQLGVLAMAGLGLVAAGAFALLAWLRTPAGTLSWDGLGWTWTVRSHAQSGELDVALDAQRLLLLRWEGAGRVQWLWLERGAQPARWDDLRRAVYSRASPP